MEKTHARIKKIFQIGIVVKDAKKTAQNWIDMFGLDEDDVMVIEPGMLPDAVRYYKGKQVNTDLLIYLINFPNNIQIELIEWLGGDENVHSDFLRETGGGLHHIGVQFDDYEAATGYFESKKVAAPYTGMTGGKEMRYMELREALGLIIEACDVPDAFVEAITG